MHLTATERTSLESVAHRIDELRVFMTQHASPSPDAPVDAWFDYLLSMRKILGNFSNSLSLVSCLLAKEYLMQNLSMEAFDVTDKPQGANGLDIDERTLDGERVIGEIKTTVPYKGDDFGAKQRTEICKDFVKLAQNEAAYKFMFVTDVAAFDVIQHRYASGIEGIKLVCLTTKDEFATTDDM